MRLRLREDIPLLLSAYRRRLRRVQSPFVQLSRSIRVYYFDLGLHRTGGQLRLMLRWFSNLVDLRVYGFEANPEYFRACANAFERDRRVTLVNAAVVGPDQSKTVRLYLAQDKHGLGDSLFEERGSSSIEVPSVRLSIFMAGAGINPTKDIVLIRMNIEGAELYVLEDLVAARLVEYIDGYYGRWDDPLRINRDLASRFAEMMAKTRIQNFPFNDRDNRAPMRNYAIRYDVTTSIASGARKAQST
jgi:FkbM family methyltransferase